MWLSNRKEGTENWNNCKYKGTNQGGSMQHEYTYRSQYVHFVLSERLSGCWVTSYKPNFGWHVAKNIQLYLPTSTLNFYQVLMNNLLPTVAAGWLWLHNPTGKLCNGCDIARNIQYTKCRSWKYCTQSFTPRTVCAIREKDITFKKSCYHGHLLHANQFSWCCSQTLMPKQSLCMAMSIMCGLKCVCI